MEWDFKVISLSVNKIWRILEDEGVEVVHWRLFLFSQTFMMSESVALQKETLIPVYVAPEDEQLLYMYEEVKQAAAARTSSIFVRGKI